MNQIATKHGQHRVEFSVTDSIGTVWFVSLTECEDGSAWAYASFPCSAVPMDFEFDGLEFDKTPTLEELIDRLEREEEARNDSAWESQVTNFYSC